MKEVFMMKKLLILMLVLGLASAANAVTVSIVSGSSDSSAVNAIAGATVDVNVICDTAVAVNFTASFMETTTSAAGNSTAATGTLHDGFDSTTNSIGGAVNGWTGGTVPRYILVHRVNGGILAGSPSIAAGQNLYEKMAVTLPGTAALGDTFTISFAVGNPTYGGSMPPYGQVIDTQVPGTRNALVITIVPEPATILLLGLGGLCLRRRK
jgi:hypothetical protein